MPIRRFCLQLEGPVTSLRGSHLFADEVSSNLWSVPSSSLVAGSVLASTDYERRNEDLLPDAGTIDMIVCFATDDAGNLYIDDLDGEIFDVMPAPPAHLLVSDCNSCIHDCTDSPMFRPRNKHT